MIKLFNKLIEVRDVSHQIHWNKSESGYNHESLQEFYTELLEKTDLFVEVYQGQYGIIDDFGTFEKIDFSNKVSYFEEFAVFVNEQRRTINEKSIHLNAIIDDIMITTYKLLFKLKHLG